MSLRKSVQKSYKQAKYDIKALFTSEQPAKGTEAGWNRLVVLKRVLSPAAESLGPLKQVVDVFAECISIFDMAANGQREYNALRVQLEMLFEELAKHLGRGPPVMTECMKSLCKFILKELDSIKLKHNRPDGRRYLEARDEQDEILDHYRRIGDSLERLSLNANLSMWKIVDRHATDYRSDHMHSLVDRLRPSLSACYNSSEAAGLKRRACSPGTRVNVRSRILDWTDGGEGALYWLNGMAGTGKTTIAYSLCESLDTEHKLAASFFCSRLRGQWRNVGLIFPSIAYQLARFSRPFRSALSDILRQDPDVHTRSLRLQFQGLIAKPLSNTESTLPVGLVIVIDALDECDDEDSTRHVLGLLLSEATSLPVRFIVASRPEPQTRDQMSNARVRPRLVLHELDTGEVQADIEKYLRQGLKPMVPAPTEAQIAALVGKAGILFIYVTTAVRYIGHSNFSDNPAARLRSILDGPRTGRTGNSEEIDQLYTVILEAALDNQKLHEDGNDDIRRVVHAVVCAREPIATQTISELLQIRNDGRVRAAIQPLYSVLLVIGDKQLVITLHDSFSDFILDSTRSTIYCCDSNAQHRRLAEHCFERIMQTKRRFNICKLESSYVPDKTIGNLQKRAGNAISPGLRYACQYWVDHVKSANCAMNLIEQIRDFLSTRLLLWIEILNLSNNLKAGIQCMKLIAEWCMALEGLQALAELADDAKHFVEVFASNPVSQSTPHLYVSMLAFWPRSAPIAKHYAKYTGGPVKVEGPTFNPQLLAHLSTWAFKKTVRAMTVSPDGLYLAVAIDSDVLVVDLYSGHVVTGPLAGRSGGARSISFSSDGSQILAGSFTDGDSHATVLGWDTRTGTITLGPHHLAGHTRSISSISFSPNCTRIATGSYDSTIHVWDTETGNPLLYLPIQGWGQGTVFSPNGSRIATAFFGALQVWESTGDTSIYAQDIQSGATLLGPLEGHTDDISCIQCSPDGGYIISGSKDRTICVWDAQKGHMVFGPLTGHTGGITLVTFTPDSSRIISACNAGSVCIWDAQGYDLASCFTNSSSSPISCSKFSPDGARFVTTHGGAILYASKY